MTTQNYIYLDHAAATPIDPQVVEAMRPFWSEQFFNPSATYLPAVAVRKELEVARMRIAGWLGARPSEIVFTAGGTEANNLAIQGVMAQFPQGNIVVSAIEHESVLHPARLYACHEAPVSADGIVDIAALLARIDDDTVLVNVMYANNEVGTIQPIRQIGQRLAEIRRERQRAGNKTPLYFHCDAAQAAQYLDIHVARLGVDLLTLNAGKLYGPKQCGLLFVASHVRLRPLILGGGQERGTRSGTENVAAVVGFAAALDLAQQRRHEETKRLQTLQKQFFKDIQAAVTQAEINGSLVHRLPNNLHITIPGADNERLLLELEQRGILCAAGSACSASNEEPSHVLRAMGRTDAVARASLRLTMGHMTTAEHIRTTIAALAQITKLLA